MPATWVIAAGQDAPDGAAFSETFDPATRYAVRPSLCPDGGDGLGHVGQCPAELDVAADELSAAVLRVQSTRIGGRRVTADHVETTGPVAISVLIQAMVHPVVSGVAFSRNPMTGLNEVVVEAVSGRGDRLVGEQATPQRWIRRWGAWSLQPEAGLLTDQVAHAIADTAVRLAAAHGKPLELEWVWDGNETWLVQAQPMSGLDQIAIYSNRISREVLPGMIKPLVWSVNVPMVNQAWVDLFTEAIGPNEIRADDLAKSFCYRAYFNMGAIGEIFELMGMPRDSLELLLGLPAGDKRPSFKPTPQTVKLLPRMTRVAWRKSRYGKTVDGEVQSLQGAYRGFAERDLEHRSDSALLMDIRALIDIGARAAYANIVTPLLANIHNALLRKRLSRAGFDPELIEISATQDLIDFNPNPHLEELAQEVGMLDEGVRAEIRSKGFAGLPDPLRGRFVDFLDKFGHLSASGNDFSVPPWQETPDEIVAMALDHEVIRGDTERLSWEEVELELSAVQRPLLRSLRRRTEMFIGHRENVSFTYTYGYGLFRRYFLEAGRRLVAREQLENAEDVMYLDLDELRAALLGMPTEPPAELVDKRRREMESLQDVSMPDVIYGDDYVPVPSRSGSGERSGIPTSRGHYRGTLRVVKDSGDFGKVAAGDVIAIPYSDVGWTPLFSRAGAVVAESGGMLSHSSIVAREYGIPCVVSVPGATQLPDGATVVVDGYAGSVYVEDEIRQ